VEGRSLVLQLQTSYVLIRRVRVGLYPKDRKPDLDVREPYTAIRADQGLLLFLRQFEPDDR
jgi:hypothetical protein